jgi:hypothetical protein
MRPVSLYLLQPNKTRDFEYEKNEAPARFSVAVRLLL